MPSGRRSDYGARKLTIQRAPGHVLEIAFSNEHSMRRYLQNMVNQEPCEIWESTNTAFMGTGWRNGQRDWSVTLNEAYTRFVQAVVIELDMRHASAHCIDLYTTDPSAFYMQIDDILAGLGVDDYSVKKTNPVYGFHIVLPLSRQDGGMLRSSENTIAVWKQVSLALHSHFEQYGSDPQAAGRLVQPYILPGLPRAKHPGFIPYIAVDRQGARTHLYTLKKHLAELGQVPRHASSTSSQQTQHTANHSTEKHDFVKEVRELAQGVEKGRRNNIASRIIAMLILKEGLSKRTQEAVAVWNQRNDPPLPERELNRLWATTARQIDHAAEKWIQMANAMWITLRIELGVIEAQTKGQAKGLPHWKNWGRTHAERMAAGGREHNHEIAEKILRYVTDQGEFRGSQAALADLIGSSKRTVALVIKEMAASGAIVLITKRGIGGYTAISLPMVETTEQTEKNLQTPSNYPNAKWGRWVGLTVSKVQSQESTGSYPANKEVLRSLGVLVLRSFRASAVRTRRFCRGGKLLFLPSPRDGP